MPGYPILMYYYAFQDHQTFISTDASEHWGCAEMCFDEKHMEKFRFFCQNDFEYVIYVFVLLFFSNL